MKRAFALLAVMLLGIARPAVGQSAADPGKPDIVSMDSLSVRPGESFVVNIRLIADDTTSHSGKKWVGVGSFCIPMKYDARSLMIDSVNFVGTIAKWDEMFTNKKIDTGFVSIGGIHYISGPDNPVFMSPDKPQEIARLYGRALKDAKPGVYTFEMTKDPIQGSPYLGATDGVNGWKPTFVTGKIVVK